MQPFVFFGTEKTQNGTARIKQNRGKKRKIKDLINQNKTHIPHADPVRSKNTDIVKIKKCIDIRKKYVIITSAQSDLRFICGYGGIGRRARFRF